MSEKTFAYSALTSWSFFVGISLAAAAIALIFINETASPGEKLILAVLVLAVAIRLEYDRRQFLHQPWKILASEERIVGVPKKGNPVTMRWDEVDRISRPSRKSIALQGPRIILEAKHSDDKIIIGKHIPRYTELARIIRDKTPHVSHEHL